MSFLSTVIAAPVDDQMYIYGQDTGSTLSADVSNLGQGFITEQLWHILNVIRFSAMIVGWIFTCIDRVYMTIQMRLASSNRHRDQRLSDSHIGV